MKKLYLLSNNIFYSLLVVTALALPYIANAEIKFNVISHITPTSIEELLVAILNIFIVIATPIIVLFIIYSGFLYVTARGNAEQVQQATRSLTYAIIGGVLVIGAVALSQVVANVVKAFSS